MFYTFKTKFTFKIDKSYHSYRIKCNYKLLWCLLDKWNHDLSLTSLSFTTLFQTANCNQLVSRLMFLLQFASIRHKKCWDQLTIYFDDKIRKNLTLPRLIIIHLCITLCNTIATGVWFSENERKWPSFKACFKCSAVQRVIFFLLVAKKFRSAVNSDGRVTRNKLIIF